MHPQAALLVALGGAAGSVLRWAAVFWIGERWLVTPFPWGTFAVNAAGSFAIGLLAEWARHGSFGVSPEARLLLVVGVLGGFTTFSSYSLETMNLLREGRPGTAILYAAGSVAVGLAAAFAGLGLAKVLAR